MSRHCFACHHLRNADSSNQDTEHLCCCRRTMHELETYPDGLRILRRSRRTGRSHLSTSCNTDRCTAAHSKITKHCKGTYQERLQERLQPRPGCAATAALLLPGCIQRRSTSMLIHSTCPPNTGRRISDRFHMGKTDLLAPSHRPRSLLEPSCAPQASSVTH